MNLRYLSAAVAVAAVVLWTLAGTATAAPISGSKHDMNTYTQVTLAYPCEACHNPHPNVASPISDVPLASRADLATATYTTYVSATLDTGGSGLGTAAPQPIGVDLLCLSCHDGTQAVDAFGGSAGTTLIQNLTGGAIAGNGNLSTNLSTTHPVSINYATVAGQTNDFYAVTGTRVDNGTTSVPLFYNGVNLEVKCASCHNVHDSAVTPFLRMSAASLCTTCHKK